MNVKKKQKKLCDNILSHIGGSHTLSLVTMIDAEPITYELRAPSGILYQIEIEAYWDDKPRKNIRVMASIDDGGSRAYAPL